MNFEICINNLGSVLKLGNCETALLKTLIIYSTAQILLDIEQYNHKYKTLVN